MSWLIVTDRIKVREVTMEDTDLFLSWWNNPEIMKDVGFEKGLNITKEQIEKQFNALVNNKDTQKTTLLVVYDINDQPIGEFSYGEIDKHDKSCRIGLKICEKQFQGKGFGHHLLIQVINYLFTSHVFNRIYIDTLTSNERAITLYKKIGSQVLEIKENFWKNPQGIIYDAIFFELTSNNFYSYYEKQRNESK